MDALSRLYIRRSVSTNGVDLEWPLLVMHSKNKGFMANTTKATVIKYEDGFVKTFGTLNCNFANNNTAAYVSVLQQVTIILRYHQDLGHI